jgi:hypothetical protein
MDAIAAGVTDWAAMTSVPPCRSASSITTIIRPAARASSAAATVGGIGRRVASVAPGGVGSSVTQVAYRPVRVLTVVPDVVL